MSTAMADQLTAPPLNYQDREKKKRHLILLPLPLVGHANPIFQLASLLHSTGSFFITIIHTRSNAPDSSKHPNFRFVTIPEPPVPGNVSPTSNIMAFVIALNAVVKEPLRDCLTWLLREIAEEEGNRAHPHDNPRCCLMADVAMYSSSAVAKELGIPMISLRTSSASCLNVFVAFPMIRDKGYLSAQCIDYHSTVPVVEMPPYRIRDLPAVFKCSSQDEIYEVIISMVNHIRSAKALILNTFVALEPVEIHKLKDEFRIPIYPIGPLHKLSPGMHGSLLERDTTCMDWLNMRHDSHDLVLYVSFGSLACMNEEELLETAWGLANSQVPFLWVLRPDSIRGNSSNSVNLLPEEFFEVTKTRGKVVQWAPQEDVLRHPSVGGFWTHCGWNSTLEAICEGVPLLCWPCFGDQMVNARLVTEVWKVGISLDNGLRRDEIMESVRMLIVLEEGMEMRRRAMNMKAEANHCIVKGEGSGSSLKHLDALMDHIISL